MNRDTGDSVSPREWVIVKATRGYDGGMGYLGPSWERAGLPIPTSPFVVKKDAERAAAALLTVNLCGWKVVPYRPPLSASREATDGVYGSAAFKAITGEEPSDA